MFGVQAWGPQLDPGGMEGGENQLPKVGYQAAKCVSWAA